jgi:hypothetical protein
LVLEIVGILYEELKAGVKQLESTPTCRTPGCLGGTSMTFEELEASCMRNRTVWGNTLQLDIQRNAKGKGAIFKGAILTQSTPQTPFLSLQHSSAKYPGNISGQKLRASE